MVAVRGKLNSRGTEDTITTKNVGVGKFKVYPDNDNRVKSRGSVVTMLKMKSVPVSNVTSQGAAIDSKIRVGLQNLDKTKVKDDGSAAVIIGRKALADISNVRTDALRNLLHDATKPLKTKGKNFTCSQRSSVGAVLKSVSSSSNKPLTEKLSANLRQATDKRHALQKEDKNHVKVSSTYLATKVGGRKSFNPVGRKSVISLPLTRNSLPVLKQVKKTSSSGLEKESTENAGTSKEKCRFSVKVKVGARVLPPGSRSRSDPSRRHVTDSFIKTALVGQGKVDTLALSRRLVKPTVIGKVRTTNDQKITKSGTIGVAALSKRKEPLRISADGDSLVCSEDPAQEMLHSESDCSSNLVPTASDIVAKKKSLRRKSYTSLLMTRSKLLKEQCENTKQDFLPNIYDDCNHLEVSEYVDEIYQYYWVMEAHHQPLKNYMEMQKEITPQMRAILVNWIIEVHLKFDLMQETLYLMVTLLDRYLSLVSIKKNEMQLVGLTALLLASKYEDFWHPRVTDLISISAESYTRNQVLGMEAAMLRKLKFRLNAPTPYVFMLRFLRAAQSDTKFEHLAYYLIELSLVEYEALNYKPSLLCASAIYLTRCTLHMTPAWTPLLGKHAHYEEPQLRNCAESILRFHKAARPGMLKVTYEKFMRPDYSRVAAINPLDKLP